MKRLLLAGLAGAAGLGTATPVQATPTWHYEGGCGFFAISDGTDSPQTQWDGEIHVLALAIDHKTGAPAGTTTIAVSCELRINGRIPGKIVLSGCEGVSVAVCVRPFSFHADPDDVVTMCDHIDVGSDWHKVCD